MRETVDEVQLIAAAKEEPDDVLRFVADEIDNAAQDDRRAVLLRARSLAQRSLGQIDASIASARSATTAAQRSGDDRLEGLALATLGMSLVYAGETEPARQALEQGRSLVSGVARLQLDMHLAGLDARVGNWHEARVGYTRVAAEAEALSELELAADALTNRGNAFAYGGQLVDARRDLERARDLFVKIGQRAGAGHTTHNLGWVAGLGGDFQRALDEYAQAVRFHPGQDEVRLIDRAEAELNAGLYRDAAIDAAEAAGLYRARNAGAEEAEALLICAQAELARGDTDAASGRAVAAARLFKDQQRPGWLAEADLVLARCDRGSVESNERLQKLAGEFASAGQTRASLTARLLAAQDGDFALLDNIERATLSVQHQLLYTRALASSLVQAGNPAAALDAVRSTLRQSAGQRAMIDSADVRSGLTAAAAGLREVAASICASQSDAAALFEFAEWGSLTVIEPPPVRAPSDERLSHAMQELRELSAELRAVEREYGETAELFDSVLAAERRVNDLGRRLQRDESNELVLPLSLSEVCARLGDVPLFRFVQVDNELVRIDLAGAGTQGTAMSTASAASIRLVGPAALAGEMAREFQREVGASLLSARDGAISSMSQERVAAIGAELEALLLDGCPMGRAAIIPDLTLAGMPWSALPSSGQRSLSVLPAAGLLRASTPTPHQSAELVRVVTIAGPALGHADAEAKLVATQYEQASTLSSTDATVVATQAAFANADIVHVAAHGHLRPDQPMLSSIELADGPLLMADLHQAGSSPRIVVLASCSSAHELPLDGNELFGAATVLLNAGSSFVVACPVLLPDSGDTTEVMVELHRVLARTGSPEDALHACRRNLTGMQGRIARSLVLFGSPMQGSAATA